MKKTKRIIMVLTLLLAFLIPTAFSNWVYLGKVADKTTINTNEIDFLKLFLFKILLFFFIFTPVLKLLYWEI